MALNSEDLAMFRGKYSVGALSHLSLPFQGNVSCLQTQPPQEVMSVTGISSKSPLNMYGQRPPQQYFAPNSSHFSGDHGSYHQDGSHHHGSQSYAPQHGPSPSSPGTDPQLWQYFTSVDTDRSGSIDVTELQSALVNGTTF